MGRKVKCGVCGQQIDLKEDKWIEYPISRYKYIHEKCKADALLIKSQEKPKKTAPKTNTKTQEEIEFDEYIKQLFNLEKMSPKIKKTANKMIKEYGFTFSGITGTLVYFYEIKKNSLEKANGNINIVPWIYEEAKEYYESINAAVAINESKDLESWVPHTEVIEIPAPQAKPKKNNLLDILKMIGGE